MMKRILAGLLAAFMCLGLISCGGGVKTSEDLPESIEIQLPASAGGGTDVVCRALLDYINENSDTEMTVVNNPDAGAVSAMEAVRTGKADGSRILFYHTSMAIKTATKLYEYSAASDFKVIAYGEPLDPGGNVLCVSASSGIESIDDFIAAANQYAADNGTPYPVGIEKGGSTHVQASMIAKALGIKLDYQDVGSDTEKLAELEAGNIPCVIVNPNQARQYAESGKITVLACLSSTSEGGRSSILPDVPSFVELGYDNCFYGMHFYVLGPKEMTEEVAQKICELFTAAAEDPDTAAILEGTGMGTTFAPYEDGAKLLSAEQSQLNSACSGLGLA